MSPLSAPAAVLLLVASSVPQAPLAGLFLSPHRVHPEV